MPPRDRGGISGPDHAAIALMISRSQNQNQAMATLSLTDIEAQIKEREEQIAQLKAAAAKQREEEISAVVQDLRRKIAEYGISAKELGLTGKSASPRRRVAASLAGPTYRGPNGETWLGGTRGRKPRWLTEELAKGKTLSDLAA